MLRAITFDNSLTDIRLHNEILDFYDFVKPVTGECQTRMKIVERVQGCIGRYQFPPSFGSVRCFGSFPAGLYLPMADMDLVYASDNHLNGAYAQFQATTKDLWTIAHRLQKDGIAREMKVIAKAKVPIIKFIDVVTGIPVDISFENLGGVWAQSYLQQWRIEYPDMAYIVAIIKQFLVMRGVSEVSTGGLGGFSVICLVVSYLQLKEATEDNLGQVLLGFLDFYGNRFDLNTTRIVMDPPARMMKVRDLLHIH
jgi:non-canonical poly(A) RNA polymerase PAPD5/7